MHEDLKDRTRRFALAIVRFYATLPTTQEAQILGRQVLRSGTSVGAHYRESHRAKSDADCISKLEGALQELEETAYWLELLTGAEIVAEPAVQPLLRECEELTSIFVTIVKKIKSRK